MQEGGEEGGHNGEYSESVQSRKPMRAKKKRKDGDTGGGEEMKDEGLSIHPGPGELVRQGPRLLEAQNPPAKQI